MGLLITAVLLTGAEIALWFLTRKSDWRWKLFGRLAAGLVACALALTVLLFFYGLWMCGRYEFPSVSSGDGNLIAEVIEEDCGAADSFHTSVNLWKERHGPSAWLLGKRGNSTTVFTVGSDPRLIRLSWKDNRTLVIQYPNDSRDPTAFRCQPQWGTIHIDSDGYSPDYNKPAGPMPPVHQSVW